MNLTMGTLGLSSKKIKIIRLLYGIVTVALIISANYSLLSLANVRNDRTNADAIAQQEFALRKVAVSELQSLSQKIAEARGIGIETQAVDEAVAPVRQLIFAEQRFI